MSFHIPAHYMTHLPHPPRRMDDATKARLDAIDAACAIWQSVDSAFAREMLRSLNRERQAWTRNVIDLSVAEITEELLEVA
jgi:hypothetical protein